MSDLERAKEIAGKLSPSERQLVLSGGAGSVSQTFAVATDNPLFKPGYNRETRDFGFTLTSLGLAVRRILEDKNGR